MPLTRVAKQSFHGPRWHLDGRRARLLGLGLVLVLIVLVPLASATPPDPLWVAGIYDGADSDDVVLVVTSLESRVEESLCLVSPFAISADVPMVERLPLPAATLRPTQARAPPLESPGERSYGT